MTLVIRFFLTFANFWRPAFSPEQAFSEIKGIYVRLYIGGLKRRVAMETRQSVTFSRWFEGLQLETDEVNKTGSYSYMRWDFRRKIFLA